MERRIEVRGSREKGILYVTSTELTIVQEIADGKTSREIAQQRNVSCKTVESHRRNILKRLECRSMPQLITILFREKILL